MDTPEVIIILVLLLVLAVALPTILAVVLNRYPLKEGIDNGSSLTKNLEDLDGQQSTARQCREWFGREPQGADYTHLLVLRVIAERWREQYGSMPLSSQTPLPSALDWVTRGNFHLRLTYDSGLFTILLRDDLSGTVVLIDSFSNSAGESKT